MQLLPFDRCDKISLAAVVQRYGSCLLFTFEISGDSSDIKIPPAAREDRGERLWRSSCFQAYVRTGKSRYIELDFSPSGQWAAYQFGEYRKGMRDFDLPAPKLGFEHGRLAATVEAPSDLQPGLPLGLAASLEHQNGTWSYWALAHVRGNRPDLHAGDCFIAQLP
jgi:hypothetical protein